MDQAAAFAAGASAAYVVGLGMGVAPALVGGVELREWSRQKWSREARALMDRLDSNWKYMLIKPKLSNRNFVQSQPEAVRVRLVQYVSILDRKMRGVAKFGLPAGPNKCICGGAVAAAADQVLGLFAISMILFPVVTANLDVQLTENIPLGTELGFICRIEEGSDSIKKLIVSLSFYSLKPEDNGREMAKVTAIFVNSILPTFIKSML